MTTNSTQKSKCETCGHVWGAYEDNCHCDFGKCHNPDSCSIRKARETMLSTTGFENKPMRVVIENWLYHTEDLSVVMDATTELRRRFAKTFPRPEWARSFRSTDNGTSGSNR